MDNMVKIFCYAAFAVAILTSCGDPETDSDTNAGGGGVFIDTGDRPLRFSALTLNTQYRPFLVELAIEIGLSGSAGSPVDEIPNRGRVLAERIIDGGYDFVALQEIFVDDDELFDTLNAAGWSGIYHTTWNLTNAGAGLMVLTPHDFVEFDTGECSAESGTIIPVGMPFTPSKPGISPCRLGVGDYVVPLRERSIGVFGNVLRTTGIQRIDSNGIGYTSTKLIPYSQYNGNPPPTDNETTVDIDESVEPQVNVQEIVSTARNSLAHYTQFNNCGGDDCRAAKGVLWAKVQLPSGHVVTVGSTHLDTTDTVRVDQLKDIDASIVKILGDEPTLWGPVYLGGDFNIKGDTPEYDQTLEPSLIATALDDVWLTNVGINGNVTDRGTTEGPYELASEPRRIDYIFSSTPENNLCHGHPRIDMGFSVSPDETGDLEEWRGLYLSDHFGIRTEINSASVNGEGCNPARAIGINVFDSDGYSEIEIPEIEFTGDHVWYYLEPGAYVIGATNDYPFEIYQSSWLSTPMNPWSDPPETDAVIRYIMELGGIRPYTWSSPEPLFIKVMPIRTGSIVGAFRVIRLDGSSKETAIPLTRSGVKTTATASNNGALSDPGFRWFHFRTLGPAFGTQQQRLLVSGRNSSEEFIVLSVEDSMGNQIAEGYGDVEVDSVNSNWADIYIQAEGGEDNLPVVSYTSDLSVAAVDLTDPRIDIQIKAIEQTELFGDDDDVYLDLLMEEPARSVVEELNDQTINIYLGDYDTGDVRSVGAALECSLGYIQTVEFTLTEDDALFTFDDDVLTGDALPPLEPEELGDIDVLGQVVASITTSLTDDTNRGEYTYQAVRTHHSPNGLSLEMIPNPTGFPDLLCRGAPSALNLQP